MLAHANRPIPRNNGRKREFAVVVYMTVQSIKIGGRLASLSPARNLWDRSEGWRTLLEGFDVRAAPFKCRV